MGVLLLGCRLDTAGVAEGSPESGESTAGGSTTAATTTQPTPTDPSAASMTGSATAFPDPDPDDGTTTSVEPTTGAPSDTTTEGPDPSSTGADPPSDCTPILAEALTSLDGGDDGREWVVLYNPCPRDYDLGPLTLAWGGTGYAGAVDLSGTIAAGACFVIGGPDSNTANFEPDYQQVENFEPNLSRDPGAIGLFLLPPAQVDVTDIPVDVVIYGGSNGGGFRDPTGATPGPVLPGAVDLHSMRRTSLGNTWEYISPPTPDACPSF